MTMLKADEVAVADPVVRQADFFSRNRLKLILVVGDAGSILLAYIVTLLAAGYASGHAILRTAVLLSSVVVAGLWAIRSQVLLLSRVSAVRTVETTRVAREVFLQAGSCSSSTASATSSSRSGRCASLLDCRSSS